jgi:uncharacterized protein CbrC (UPF0167 family)
VFGLGIGDAIIVACPSCRAENALDVFDATSAPCTRCSTGLEFPSLSGPVLACADCLRAGRAAINHNTELGMVGWQHACQGWTHGLPLAPRGWETSEPDQDGWSRVRVPRELLENLVRTPEYPTIQGERWLFCCKEPMVYLGEWSRARFTQEARDGDGERLFGEIVEDVGPDLWGNDFLDDGVYVFECDRCGKRRAHWDVA